MGEIARWANHYFKITSSFIRSLSSMEIKASCETSEKSADGEKYLSRKNSKPTEIKLTIPLSAHLGITDVKKEATTFLSEAQAGKKGYFYAASKKLFTYQLMLTEATIKNKVIGPDGKWISVDVELLLKQCTKIDGSIPKPKPKKPTTTTPTETTETTETPTGADPEKERRTTYEEAQSVIKRITSKAHEVSFVIQGGSGGGGRMAEVSVKR